MSSNRCFANISPQGIEMIEENRFESASLNGLSMPVLIQYEDGINEADAADGKIREPRAESREPRAYGLVMFTRAFDTPAEPMRTPPIA